MPGRISRILTSGTMALMMVLLLAQSIPAAPPRPLFASEFTEVAPQGFGDRQNSGVWSMQWWDGKLYVGTVRAWYCWSRAWLDTAYPGLPWPPYPPQDPDLECAADPRDLPLRAEIWRFTPETSSWERVYQSPEDVEIPSSPGWYTARDVGYRTMTVFREPDGTEALYVGGVTSYLLWPPVPPPRILRSTDGLTFEPIPQDPGTLLGDLGQDQTSFRTMRTYKDRLYLINGQVHGEGSVLEAVDPAGGNDNFRWVTPLDMQVFEMAAFNGYLYMGLVDRINGYTVVKTDATGALPYSFTPVVTDGAYRSGRPSPAVVSMAVFEDRLYVGTDDPTEIIRINPDDSWDLVVGSPRETPDGWKYPLSGMDTGFDWFFTQHMWRMQVHEDVLYVGTMDMSTRWRNVPGMDERVGDRYGFDLYATTDGQHFRAVTMDGLGDKFQNGLRNLASTPYGLYLGTVSFWYGMRVWNGTYGVSYSAYLPLLIKSSGGMAAIEGPTVSGLVGLAPGKLALSMEPPQRLEAERTSRGVALSWEPSRGPIRYRVYRSEFESNRVLRLPDVDPDAWIPGPFTEIGTTDQWFYIDETTRPDRPYNYYILAEDGVGRRSPASNLARLPSLLPPATFESVRGEADQWLGSYGTVSADAMAFSSALGAAREQVSAGDAAGAVTQLEELGQRVGNGQTMRSEPWRAHDLEILLAKLTRRVRLAEAGIIAPSDLE